MSYMRHPVGIRKFSELPWNRPFPKTASNRAWLWSASFVTLAAILPASHGAELDKSKLPPAAERQIDYVKDVRPIFERSCYTCHGPEKQKNNFRLDVRAAALKGGDDNVDILPGKSVESPLIH